jgi:hypothetical protein
MDVCSGQGPGPDAELPMPVALKMLLQLAVRNIGQLTDIESRCCCPDRQ